MIKRGNVLVLGDSSGGKSAIINALYLNETTETNWESGGISLKLKTYDSNTAPFRVIDLVGFELDSLSKDKGPHIIKKWTKDTMKDENQEYQVHAVWLCMDGTVENLLSKEMDMLLKVVRMYKSIPIIAVITHSTSVEERAGSIELVNEFFTDKKINLAKIICPFERIDLINDISQLASQEILELINTTNHLIPEAMEAVKKDMHKLKLNKKRAMAHGVVTTATASAVVVGAVPLPLADAIVLSSIEALEIKSIAKIYGIDKKENFHKVMTAIVEAGTVSMAARGAISGLKAIPGINLGASIINAVIAGVFAALIGESVTYAFEQIYLGNKVLGDIDWITELIESSLESEFIAKVTSVLQKITEATNKKEIADIISELFQNKSKQKSKHKYKSQTYSKSRTRAKVQR